MEENTVISSPISPEQDDDESFLSTPAKIGIGVGILVGVALLVLAIILMLRNPATTETIRDLFIIVLALESLVIGTLLVVLVYQLIVLIKMLRNDVKPMLESIKGTTTFVSQRVTKPAMAASSYVSGIGRSVSTLMKMLPRRHRASPTPSSTENTTSEPSET